MVYSTGNIVGHTSKIEKEEKYSPVVNVGSPTKQCKFLLVMPKYEGKYNFSFLSIPEVDEKQ